MQQDEVNNLIFRSRQNDQAAFREIVEAHQHLVYSLAFRLLYNDEDAQDIVQETFIKVWKHLLDFNIEMKFTTWLYKIATNSCYDRIKVLKRSNNHTFSFDLEKAVLLNQPSLENLETDLINSELAQIIKQLTNDLPPKQKLVFTLRDLEGLEIDEITEITGLSAKKVKSNIYCARQFIREKLENL
jgi:RNA polymerase sigma-70 factor (ECF subfamily)